MAETYWRCKRCGSVVASSRDNVVACPCGCGWGEWEPVAVLPVAELEALRALKARVEDEAMARRVAQAPGNHSLDRENAIDAYRAALRGEGKGNVEGMGNEYTV